MAVEIAVRLKRGGVIAEEFGPFGTPQAAMRIVTVQWAKADEEGTLDGLSIVLAEDGIETATPPPDDGEDE